MASIFDGIQTYDPKWVVLSEEKLSDDDKKLVKSAQVVSSQYGLSVCFFMTNGLLAYIPLDENSTASEGDWVNVDKCTIKLLGKEGRKPIKRVFVDE